ncbi:MAG: VanZ family protein [Lachnospiraceae bacterium]|nr:VanZ family protein [Lachnospiraceae bacterium]
MSMVLIFGIEVFSSVVFVLPAVFIWRYFILKKHGFFETAAVMVFSCYLAGVFMVTGIPSVMSWNIDPDFNLIPLIDIANNPLAYIRNTILNILLFMPFGFLLPALWKKYRSLRTAAVSGLLFSMLIEMLQIFTFRLTDVDDLITNTAGTVLGYCIGRRLGFRLPFVIPKDEEQDSGREAAILFGIVFLISFFLKPILSNAVWSMVL